MQIDRTGYVVLNDMTSMGYELEMMRKIAIMAYFKILSKSLTELFRLPTVSLLLVVIELLLSAVSELRVRHSLIMAVPGLTVKGKGKVVPVLI
jgi:hypothetical protein